MNNSAEFLTTDEAAELISVTPRTIQRFKREGKLPFAKMGTRVRFRRSAVLALLSPGRSLGKSWTHTRWTSDAEALPSSIIRKPSRTAEFVE